MPSNTPRILRLPEVMERVGLSRPAIYIKIGNGSFPKGRKIGSGRAVGWLESDLNAWIESCFEEEAK